MSREPEALVSGFFCCAWRYYGFHSSPRRLTRSFAPKEITAWATRGHCLAFPSFPYVVGVVCAYMCVAVFAGG